MKEIKIVGTGWEINLVVDEPGRGGSLESDMHQGTQDDLDAALHGVTSLVLAQACAGIDVTTPEYSAALDTAINTMHQRYG
jgi:hypothetical protein